MEISGDSGALKFHHPTTVLISGPTGCGKTKFVSRLLLHSKEMFQPSPTRIVWVYAEWQPEYDRIEKLPCVGSRIEFRENGLNRDLYESFRPEEKNLLVLDDQMSNDGSCQSRAISQSRRTILQQLFTQGSHHRSLSIIYVVQNLFDQGGFSRTISLNSQYIVLFKNPRDAGQIRYLAQQVYPKNSQFLVDSYTDATIDPYSYMMLNLTQCCPDWARVCSHVFPDESNEYYIPYSMQLPSDFCL